VTSWRDQEKVDEYLGRVGRLDARRAGEVELAEALPAKVERVLDLGCGDGALLRLVLHERSQLVDAVGLDSSPPMIRRAREHFHDDRRVRILDHDLADPVPPLGSFDAVVSGFAIHHLTHERKQQLFAEVAELLNPGAKFANLEVVQCATPELQADFERRIGRVGGDPEDRLAPVHVQLEWMREAGLVQVDYWRWRGFALLVGAAPTDHD
jgi:cyclopropane fatty-acyl-phospholipid synthase-like methyltransferase